MVRRPYYGGGRTMCKRWKVLLQPQGRKNAPTFEVEVVRRAGGRLVMTTPTMPHVVLHRSTLKRRTVLRTKDGDSLHFLIVGITPIMEGEQSNAHHRGRNSGAHGNAA
jgi:hypothetical protein